MGGVSRMHGREVRERRSMAGRFVPGVFDLTAEDGRRLDRQRHLCPVARLGAGAEAGAASRTGGA